MFNDLNDKIYAFRRFNIKKNVDIYISAERVSNERGWPVGTLVGYDMGLHKNVNHDTRITYCPPDVLLNNFLSNKSMTDYTIVILDDIHEYNKDMDFLILLVREFLRTTSPRVKVVLMSTTIDVDKFAQYFAMPVGNEFVPALIIDIPNWKAYNLSIWYIDQIEDFGCIPTVDEEPKFATAMAEFADVKRDGQ
ncbi:probable ATP-dependent RNA helicase spindle-E isoform X2 [Temnothorax longispinosus]|uniref:probable ATP-dependent RNA helicase spindle-E isoform X2 n=1 Tax=Temnothorax longispinosus TaxID=300112 RepID=UPI003A991D73